MFETWTDTNKWNGEFWIKPGDPVAWPGVLRYHPTSGLSLSISGSSDEREQPKDYPVILGIIEGRRHIALLDCFDNGGRFHLSSFQERDIFANTAVLGVPEFDPRRPMFSRLHFCSPNLTHWLGSRGLHVGMRRGLGAIIEWRPPKKPKAKLDELRTLEFFCGYKRASGLVDGKVRFEVKPRFSLRYADRQTWENVHWDIFSLDLFFCFATRSWRGPPQIGLESRSSRRVLKDPEGETKAKRRAWHDPHVVLVSQSWYRLGKEEKDRSFRPPVGFAEVLPRLEALLAEWFRHRRVIERAVGLLRASQQPEGGAETSFLFLAQAAEFLHREIIGGTLIDESQFEKLKEALVAAIPQTLDGETRHVVTDKLLYFNEPGLRRRLKELFRAVRNPPTFVGNYKDLSNYITHYRNAFTHHLPISKPADVWVQEVAQLSDVLTSLIELYIFRLLGFSEAEIDQVVQSDWNIKRSFQT